MGGDRLVICRVEVQYAQMLGGMEHMPQMGRVSWLGSGSGSERGERNTFSVVYWVFMSRGKRRGEGERFLSSRSVTSDMETSSENLSSENS